MLKRKSCFVPREGLRRSVCVHTTWDSLLTRDRKKARDPSASSVWGSRADLLGTPGNQYIRGDGNNPHIRGKCGVLAPLLCSLREITWKCQRGFFLF